MTGPEEEKLRDFLKDRNFLSILAYRVQPVFFKWFSRFRSWRRLSILLVILLWAYATNREVLIARYRIAVLFTLVAIWSYYQRDLEIRGLPKLWKWIERRYPRLYKRLPEEPPLKQLDVERLGWERYVHIRASRWLIIILSLIVAMVSGLWAFFSETSQ